MPVNKRSLEGEILIDHRNSPGLTPEFVHHADLPPGAGRGVFEAPTFTCSHCQRVVVINPARTRERAWCKGCDHYLCDPCGAQRAASGECKTVKQVIDEYLEKASRST